MSRHLSLDHASAASSLRRLTVRMVSFRGSEAHGGQRCLPLSGSAFPQPLRARGPLVQVALPNPQADVPRDCAKPHAGSSFRRGILPCYLFLAFYLFILLWQGVLGLPSTLCWI